MIEFCENRQLVLSLPLPSVLICNFIGHLLAKSYSPATITSHVSALSYIHKVLDIDDQSNSFIVRKMLKGCDKVHGSVCDSRLPITKAILKQMLAGLETCVVDVSIQLLLKAVFLLAFSAFLRLGEILIRSKQDCTKVVQVQDICFPEVDKSKIPESLSLQLRHFKNMRSHHPISIEASPNEPDTCPVRALFLYILNISQDHYFNFGIIIQSPTSLLLHRWLRYCTL